MTLHDDELAGRETEELAEELWTLAEEGRDRLDDLRRTTQVRPLEGALNRLVREGLAVRERGRILLTAAGRSLAERQVRRHRLAEMLFATALEVRDDRVVNRTACVMEHVLDAATTDAVCAFLGHPQLCPHGKAIPPGPCCRSFERPAAPLVEPLARLGPGEEARVVHVVPREPGRLVRLSGLGLLPGAVLQLQQHSPATVVRIGETTVALEPSIASEIYVRRLPAAAERRAGP